MEQFKTVQDFGKRFTSNELEFSFEYTNRDSLLQSNFHN